MFDVEAEFRSNQRRHGLIAAREFFADINRYTNLQTLADAQASKQKPALHHSRTLFDFNEHFIELTNMGAEDRSMISVIVAIPMFLMFFSAWMWIEWSLRIPTGTKDWFIMFLSGFVATAFCAFLIYLLWPDKIAPIAFTSLRARYRFNRTTRKVYVLRPKRYGGNVILDWDKVQAHPEWCAGLEMQPSEIHDPQARALRQQRQGGAFCLRCLVLYWPSDDETGQSAEVLWVGPKRSGEPLWAYIWTFMEKGMDAVPAPNEHEWLRKGFSTPAQHLHETELSGMIAYDALTRQGKPSANTQFSFMASAIWAPLHCLIERTCYWPTFPKEWNSDCGQLRKESGIGPEEPLRWTPRNLNGTELMPAKVG